VIRIAQLLFVVTAAALWVASRLTWVQVSSFNGLGQPQTARLTGAQWSTALIPLALLVLAAAVAALAVRGWMLRALAVLVAAAAAGMAYLGITLWVVEDVAVRAANLAQVAVADLTGTQRSYTGAAVTVAAAVCALAGAVLMMRSAATVRASTGRYAAPAARRAAAADRDASDDGMSERMIWDALDDGRDPTNDAAGPNGKGR
jgi:uncharacterized membrane protein (TIGR02234 family)